MTQADSVLHRKTGARTGAKTGTGRPEPEMLSMSPEKALRLAFGRAGRDRTGLGLRVTSVGIERTSLSVLASAGAGAEGGLAMTLCRGMQPGGAMLADAGVIAALIEAETMGRVGRMPAEPRRPTRIDALIAGAFVDGALSLFDELAQGLSIADASRAWRVGEMVPRPEVLPLILDEVPLRLFRIDMDFAEGARQGSLRLAMPFEAPRQAETPRDDDFTAALEAAVMRAPTQVRAVLAQVTVPLDTVLDWTPGAVLPIPRSALSMVRLEDISGETVATGRLGQISGMRAVRLDPGGDA